MKKEIKNLEGLTFLRGMPLKPKQLKTKEPTDRFTKRKWGIVFKKPDGSSPFNRKIRFVNYAKLERIKSKKQTCEGWWQVNGKELRAVKIFEREFIKSVKKNDDIIDLVDQCAMYYSKYGARIAND